MSKSRYFPATRRTDRRLLQTGSLLLGSCFYFGCTQAATFPCGSSDYRPETEQGTFLWRDCHDGGWRLRVTAGGQPSATYNGSMVSSAAFARHVPIMIEPHDTLDRISPRRTEYTFIVFKHGQDGIDFSLAAGASACLDAGGPVSVGPGRTVIRSPFDIGTLGQCEGQYAYLNDADLTDSVTTVADSDLGEQPFPRISTGPVLPPVSPEQFSKYRVITVRANAFKWLAEVQAINPETRGLRAHSPFAFQGFNGQVCSQADGMPFADTGPVTAGCEVYAGHWLYAPGSRLRHDITDDSTRLKVADATRFNAGRYVVIYDGGPGAFINAEHARVTMVDTATNTLTLANRGFKSTPKAHRSGAIVAEHVIGNGASLEPGLWAYNQSIACPPDGSGRQLNAVMAEWLANNYQRDGRGEVSPAKLDGILFDTDFYFLAQSGERLPDVDNDLVLDDGISSTGENLWGSGLETFYALLRERLPNVILVGGVIDTRGYASLNGTQLEGWPRRFPFMSATPDYPEIGGRLSAYSIQMHHGRVGPRLAIAENKMPTKLYPSAADPNPADNSGFRFGFGLMLLDDGYYGQANWHVPDPWWDEYAVDVVPGSATFGQAIASNPRDESLIRRHRGWMGFPLGPRYRLYDPVSFAPERNLLANGSFDSDLTGWSGTNVTLARVTAADNRLDGSGALHISAPLGDASELVDAAAVGPTVPLIQGVDYTLAFGVRSSTIRTIRAAVAEQTENFTIPDTWSRQVFTFTAARTGNFPLRIYVGKERSEVWVDSIYLFEGNADVFRRDFDHAVVIVNATPSSRTIDLSGTLKRIKGTGQDPVNNGATIRALTLPPYDAAVLIRP